MKAQYWKEIKKMGSKLLWTGLFIITALSSLITVANATLIGAIVMGVGLVLAWFNK